MVFNETCTSKRIPNVSCDGVEELKNSMFRLCVDSEINLYFPLGRRIDTVPTLLLFFSLFVKDAPLQILASYNMKLATVGSLFHDTQLEIKC